jgi:hypothetical protein
MLYLITQNQSSELHDKLQQEGCSLLLTSDQLDFAVYGLENASETSIRSVCQAFKQYAREILKKDFLFDIFTRDEIVETGQFSPEFVAALKIQES